MRLLLVGPSWPFRGGVARATTLLAQALEAQGALAGFLVPWRQYPRFLYPGSSDWDEKACPRLAQATPCFSLFNPFSWRRLSQWAKRLGPDAVVVPHWTAAWTPLEYFLTLHPWPIFGVVHNPADHDGSPWSRWASWVTLRRFRGFLTHAKAVAWRLERWFPEKAVRVYPLPPPETTAVAQEEARRALGLPLGATVFLFFGLVRPYKGVDILLDAAPLIPRERPWVLAVAGEVWGMAGALDRRLREPSLKGRVVLHRRWVPEEETHLWFSAADVVVLPYLRATGSAVAAQALAYGLPLVVTRCGGLQDVVQAGVNGLVVEPGDAAGLAQAMGALLDPEFRQELARGARVLGRQWSWRVYASTLVELVREALARGV
ncbi:MAG: glycosyltransferase family 4 protein [Thermoanaerobaculum sp.]|nr:glycosyltransferase family 4 protein [Thermoanaerobaculum sp.]MDW7968602.1 glycosyltransferase family 4 protein [Thermoanaerobaculum sp.]